MAHCFRNFRPQLVGQVVFGAVLRQAVRAGAHCGAMNQDTKSREEDRL